MDRSRLSSKRLSVALGSALLGASSWLACINAVRTPLVHVLDRWLGARAYGLRRSNRSAR
jgi:hypothetical protein